MQKSYSHLEKVEVALRTEWAGGVTEAEEMIQELARDSASAVYRVAAIAEACSREGYSLAETSPAESKIYKKIASDIRDSLNGY